MKPSIFVFFVLLLIAIGSTHCSYQRDDSFELEAPGEEAGIDTSHFRVDGILFSNGEVRDISFYSAKIIGNFASIDPNAPILDHGHVWSSVYYNPKIGKNSFYKSNGPRQTLGSFSTYLEGLEPGKDYYVKAYIVVGSDTIYHNQTVSFSTYSPGFADVIIEGPSDVSENEFCVKIVLKSDGGSPINQLGFVWSFSKEFPTLEDNDNVYLRDTFYNNNNNNDFFKCIRELEALTIVYIRAFVTNESGTAYSNSKKVVTESGYEVVDGLIAYYRFENNADDEWKEYSGNAVGVKYSDNTASGIGFSALFQPSLESYVSIPKNPLRNIEKGTITVWLKAINRATQCILHGNDYDKPLGFDIVYHEDEIKFNTIEGIDSCATLTTWPQNFPINLSSFLFDGEWHFLGITIEHGEQILYVDGNLMKVQENNSGLKNTDTPTLNIGRFYKECNANYYFDGLMDNLRLYNRVLEKEEIMSIYDSEK